jgi:signal peptidase I
VRAMLNWGLFVTILLVAWLLAGPTQVGGSASYVIVDGRSMEPTYNHGDLVIAKATSSYEPGEIIVYDAPVDARFNVIHRIVATTEGGYVTQGDNMARPDGWIAPHGTIHGAAVLHIPRGGALVTFLRQPAVVLGLLAGFLTFEYLKRSERRPVTTDGGEADATMRTTSSEVGRSAP